MSVDYIVLTIAGLVVICFFILFLRGKKISTNKKVRYYPLLFVVLAILSTLYLNHYSISQLNMEIEKFQILLGRKGGYSFDSLSFTKENKEAVIDSLKRLEEEYNGILFNLKKQEKITGNKPNIVTDVEKEISKTNKEIYRIETYNAIVNDSIYDGKMKGYTHRDKNVTKFIFQPPKDKSGEYLDFIIKFRDERILDKIVLFLEVCKREDETHLTHIFSQFYFPQKGVNAFRIKNYLKDKNTEIKIGYFMKNEIGKKEYPNYECITYSIK